jgi:hypothetical protein
MLLEPGDLARINNKKKYKSQYQIAKKKRIQSTEIKKIYWVLWIILQET